MEIKGFGLRVPLFKPIDNPDETTAAAIVDGSLTIGLNVLTEDKDAYVRLTDNLLNKDIGSLLSPESFVLEIKGDNEDIKDNIHELKEKGYRIAVDLKESFDVLPEIFNDIDILQVNFSTTGFDLIMKILNPTIKEKVQLMAVDVREREQYVFASGFGFHLFSGNFFMEPSLVVSQDVEIFKSAYLHLMNDLYKPNPEFVEISKTVASDVALSYKILKLVNSSAYSGRNKITDIQQALVRIGMKDLYKWFSLIVLREFSANKPNIYAQTSLIRAKTLECAAKKAGLSKLKDELFIVAMFSMMDIILDRPMADVTKELPLSENAIDALNGEDNDLNKLLQVMVAFEKGQDVNMDEGVGQYIPECYLDAIEWVQSILD